MNHGVTFTQSPDREYITVIELSAYQALKAEVSKIAWINECRCDKAWTERGRHEPNAYCGELDNLLALVDPQAESKDET